MGVITAAVQVIVAFGLSLMKKWAWALALIGVALILIQGLISIISGGMFGFICGSFGLIVPAIILFYLVRKDIRAAFGVGAA